MASSTPPNAADLAAERMPVRSDRKPPVMAPAAMEFQGSSCGSDAAAHSRSLHSAAITGESNTAVLSTCEQAYGVTLRPKSHRSSESCEEKRPGL